MWQVRVAPGADKQAILQETLRGLQAAGVGDLCVQVEDMADHTASDHLASAQLMRLEAM